MHHLPSQYIPCDGSLIASTYFNPRSPHRERLEHSQREDHHRPISIHAPRGGSDSQMIGKFTRRKFQSTLPVGGSDIILLRVRDYHNISIHAPRMGSDSTVKAYSNDRIKRSTLREPHFLFSKNACFSPIVSMCAATSRTKNQRIRVSFGSYPGLAPTCFTLDWYRFPRL